MGQYLGYHPAPVLVFFRELKVDPVLIGAPALYSSIP